MLKNICKRVLSTVLVLTLIATTFFIFDPTALFPKAEAAVTSTGNELLFVVPETIYLAPDGIAWKVATTTPFQYYINNDSSGSPVTEKSTTGKIYIKYAKTTGTTTLSYRFFDRYLTNNYDSDSNKSVTLSASSWSGALSSTQTVNITAGKSPSLPSDHTGCYIEWTLSYTDSLDSVEKKAYAYTYVYKPYTAPLGAGVRNEYYKGYAGALGWISGVHSITAQSVRSDTETDGDASFSREMGYPFYTYHKNGNSWDGKALAAFISESSKGYVGSTQTAAGAQHLSDSYLTGATSGRTITYASGASEDYVIFANTATGSSENNAHCDVTASNNNADNWINKGDSGSYNYPHKSFQYNSASSSKDYVVCRVWNNSYASINVDTSRYSNLKDIPNLALGLLVTDDQSSGNNTAGWYVADYTGMSGHSHRDGVDADNYMSGLSYSTDTKDHGPLIASQLTYNNGAENDKHNFTEEEGLRYAGKWPRAIDSNTTYTVKMMYSNQDGSTSGLDCIFLDLKMTKYDKSKLRAAVKRAIAAMPALGINGCANGNAKITSYYYSNSEMSGLGLAFHKAMRVLGSVDMQTTISTSPDELANDLDNEIQKLMLADKVFEYAKENNEANSSFTADGKTIYNDIKTNKNYYKYTYNDMITNRNNLRNAMKIELNSAKTATINTGGKVYTFCFTANATTTHVFFGLATEQAKDNEGFIMSTTGSQLAYNDDISSDNATLIGVHSYQHGVTASLTSGTVYYLRTNFLNSDTTSTYNVKICKTVTLTFRGTGGTPDSKAYSNMPGGHTFKPNAISNPTRSGYTLIAWSKSGKSNEPKEFMSSATSAAIPTSNQSYWALWKQTSPTTASVNTQYTSTISAVGQMNFWKFTPSETRKYVIYSNSTSTANADPFLIVAKKSDWESSATYMNTDDDSGSDDHPDFIGTTVDRNFYLEVSLTKDTDYLIMPKAYHDGTSPSDGTGLGDVTWKMEPIYTVTYNANSGTNAPSAQSKYYGRNLTLTSSQPASLRGSFSPSFPSGICFKKPPLGILRARFRSVAISAAVW